jgi:hypothetical protein
VKRPHPTRTFAIAALAAILSVGAPATGSLVADAGASADLGATRAVPPLVTRIEARPLRVALQASFRSALSTLALPATGTPALGAPSWRSLEAGSPAALAPGRAGTFVRTSRGPPLG